ncbi:RING finger 17 [Labeo rohita]|uniref:RING finger 17 n=1 Tax=Labeo rohita TaxID=84645 RepID=A0A498NEW2_LABRO|nr:RING finger 17 [Labeo rohita]
MSETAVACNICGSSYTLPEDEAGGNLPHVLLCSHIFCSTCLRALESPQNVITCPECQRPDVVKVLDEALGKATENLNRLDKIHKTLSNGIHAQLRKERTRIIREIDEAVDKAKSALLKRRSMLVSKLSDVDHLFSDGRKECKKIEERIKELQTAIQKARHVRQVPSLETYCNLDETLHIPVDVQSYDMSSMSLRSGLSCSLQMDSLVDSLRNCLKITNDDDDCILEEVTVEPFQHVVKSGVEVWDSTGQAVSANADPIPKKKSACRPSFIEEIMEDPDTSSEIVEIVVHYVMATHIVSPGHFYVRYMMEQRSGQKLNKKVNEFCSGDSSLFTFSDEIKTGSMLFFCWKEDMWCRVTVTELFQRECFQSVTKCLASEVSRLSIYFQDYGFAKGISIPSDGGLSMLNECLRRPDAVTLAEINGWAPLAIRCSLKDIIPADLLRGWSLEATDEMRSLLGSEAVEMQVFGEDGDALLVDLKKTPMVSLREHLVFMELARFYSPIVAPGSAPLLFYSSVRPALNVEVNAMVSHVNTPSDFYIQLVENMEYLLLHSKLQDCYSRPNANSEFQIYCPSLSQACIARYDQEWCRVQVIGFPGGRMVEVRYVDFGYRKTISVNDLRQIKDEFFALPEMALWCSLNDVVSPQETWSDEACTAFKELVERKLITVVAKKLVPGTRPVPVCLYEIGDDYTGASIGEILVRNGLAVFSKQTQIKDTQPMETTVWDPPFEEETLSVALPPPPPASEELQPSLILPTCLKDIKVRVTHVTSPGNICVQLLQFDSQLKRIHDMLKSLFSKSEPQEILWEAEMFCAANNTGVWERGQVCSVSTNGVAEDPSASPVLVSLFCSNRAGQNVSFADFLISEGLALKERKAASVSETVFSEECVLSEKISEPQRLMSASQTPPTPTPRINPPPERVQTHSYPPPELPLCGHTLMSISAISEQGVIYAMTHQAVCEFDRLRERLQQHIKTLPRQKNYNWKGVLGCAVMGTDMFWYRGQVQEVIGGHVKVQYVDQGLVESIPVCHVYPMVLCEDVPQLCVPCQINGVIPIGNGWQWDAVVLMKELLLGRSVDVHIIEHPEDPCGCVKVEITVDGMALSRIMVHHQYATFDPAISSQEDYVVKPPVPDLDDWDLNTEGLEEPQPVLGVYKELQISKARKHFPAKVKHIRTPNEVFLCVLDKTLCKQEQGESLEEALKRVNENVENLSLLTDFPIECPCLAEYSDGKYYRAKLLGFSELTPSVKLLVRHVDFGSDDIIPTHKLRQLPASLHHFPCAAIYVKLAGFKPANVCLEMERIPYRPEWSMRAMMEMIDLLNGELTAVVTANEPQLTVLLYNAEGTLVHRPLVEKGLAEYA